MKTAIACLILTTSTFTIACPEISGIYSKCESTSNMDMFNVKSATIVIDAEKKMTVGLMTGEETSVADYVLDGVARTSTEDVSGEIVTLETTATCDESSVLVVTKDDIFNMTQEDRLSKDSDNNLVIQTTVDGEVFNTTTCKSIN